MRTPNFLQSKFLSIALVVSLFAMLTGCGTKSESEEVAELRSNMQSLAAAYGTYTKTNRGRVPKSEKQFRTWIEKQGPDELTILGVETIDDLFTSSRDNEPYVVVYGKSKQIVAYEAVGVDGERYVADNLGSIELVDEARFRELVPDAE